MTMHPAEPQEQHQWLLKMVGDWTFEGEAQGPPDDPSHKSSGNETVRSVGDLWIVGESSSQFSSGDGPTFKALITIGYDPQRGKFVGTWIGSMMHKMWIYEGELDESGRKLSLHSEGPSFEGPEKTSKYIDAIELVSDDHRIFTGSVQGEDGNWTTFMTAHYRRVK